MCILCGGQCGGVVDLLISLGLPFVAIYFMRMKGFLTRIKNRILDYAAKIGVNKANHMIEGG
jgi:hypothetical protein